MDPSFYSIMKTLSTSITLSLTIPYRSHLDSGDCAFINITISTELTAMPCWDEADYALRSVLMWVSASFNNINCQLKIIILFHQAKSYARANINGIQQSKETDRSLVVTLDSRADSTDQRLSHQATNVLMQPSNAWAFVLGIFYFSNLLVLTSTLLNFCKVFFGSMGKINKLKLFTKQVLQC